MSSPAWQNLRMRQEICSSLVAGALALGGLFAIAPIPLAAEASAPKCVAPANITRLDLPLTRTAHRLAARDRIIIVALGSSSTAGVRSTRPGLAAFFFLDAGARELFDKDAINTGG